MYDWICFHYPQPCQYFSAGCKWFHQYYHFISPFWQIWIEPQAIISIIDFQPIDLQQRFVNSSSISNHFNLFFPSQLSVLGSVSSTGAGPVPPDSVPPTGAVISWVSETPFLRLTFQFWYFYPTCHRHESKTILWMPNNHRHESHTYIYFSGLQTASARLHHPE